MTRLSLSYFWGDFSVYFRAVPHYFHCSMNSSAKAAFEPEKQMTLKLCGHTASSNPKPTLVLGLLAELCCVACHEWLRKIFICLRAG